MKKNFPDVTNHALMKRINRVKVLNAIRLHSPVSRSAIAGLTRLDKKSITNFIGELLHEGLVEEIGKQRTEVGRPFTLLSFHGGRPLMAGLSIEPDGVKGVLLNLYGQEVAAQVAPEQSGHKPQTARPLALAAVAAELAAQQQELQVLTVQAQVEQERLLLLLLLASSSSPTQSRPTLTKRSLLRPARRSPFRPILVATGKLKLLARALVERARLDSEARVAAIMPASLARTHLILH